MYAALSKGRYKLPVFTDRKHGPWTPVLLWTPVLQVEDIKTSLTIAPTDVVGPYSRVSKNDTRVHEPVITGSECRA